MLKLRAISAGCASIIAVGLVYAGALFFGWAHENAVMTAAAGSGCLAVVAGVLSAALDDRGLGQSESAKWLGFGFALSAFFLLARLAFDHDAYTAVGLWGALALAVLYASCWLDFGTMGIKGWPLATSVLFLATAGTAFGGAADPFVFISMAFALGAIIDYLNRPKSASGAPAG